MGGELIKTNNSSPKILNMGRNEKLKKNKNSKSLDTKVYIKTEVKDVSGKMIHLERQSLRRQNQKLSIIARNLTKNKELSMMELIQNKNPNKLDYDLINECIENHPFMQSLTKQARNEIIVNMSLYKIKEDTTIYTQGSYGFCWYIVHKGNLSRYIDDKLVQNLRIGDSFGEIALMNNTPHKGTIKTVTECKLWVLKKEKFEKIRDFLLKVNYQENSKFIKTFQLPLDEELKRKLAYNLVKNIYKEDDIIYKQGSTCSRIYLIKKGEVDIFRNNELLETLTKTQYFGQNGLLEGHRRTTDAIAKTDCILYSISLDFFRQELGNDFEDQLYFSLMRIVFSKSKNYNSINSTLLNKTFHTFSFKKYNKDEVVYKKGINARKKICLILEGNIVDKIINKVEGKRYDILFENELKSKSEYIIKNDLIAEPDCLIAEANYDEFKDALGGGYKKAKKTSNEIKVLEKIRIFEYFSLEAKEEILKYLKIEVFNNGNKIISQGKTANKLYIIKKGRVDVFLNSKYIKSAFEGEDFGSKFLFFKNAKYLMTIIANGYVECYTLKEEAFKKFLNPTLMEYFKKKYYLNDFSLELKDLENIKELGEGNYGSVNLVRSKKNKQLYAVKTLDIGQIKIEKMENNIEQEKNLLLKLDHPFIAKMVKYLKTDKKIFFILEYVQGKELWEVMRMIGLCNQNQTKFYTASLLTVANYLHKKNIIYRDIKPENIMITDKGYIKIVDFGTAKEITDRTTTIIGTYSYMAPESLEGSPYSFEVDIWAIAICMYELYCGYVPFSQNIDEDDPILYYNAIINEGLSFPEFVHDEQFMNILMKMLNKDLKNRLTQFEIIKQHPYFKDFEWEKLLQFSISAPYLFEIDAEIKNDKVMPFLSYLKNYEKNNGIKRLETKREIIFSKWLKNF